MKTTLTSQSLSSTLSELATSNSAYARVYPGEPIDRQPVHTIYGGGHLFKKDTARRLGDVALASLRDYAPDFATFARAIGLRGCESLPETSAAAAAIDAEFERDPSGAAKANPHAAFAAGRPEGVRVLSRPVLRRSGPDGPNSNSRHPRAQAH